MKWYLATVKWLLSSIGLTGILVVIGFIIDASFQNKLGYQTNTFGSVAYYITLAGTFFVDIVLLFFWCVETYWYFALTLLLIILALALLHRFSKLRVRCPPTKLINLLLVVATALSLLFFDMPATKLEGFLNKTLIPETKRSGSYLDKLAYALWLDQICPLFKDIPDSKLPEEFLKDCYGNKCGKKGIRDVHSCPN